MSIAEANLELPVDFTGIVKIFPLPNLVLFPGVIQPLHIFEPRYRALMRDALEGDQLIGLATLQPGWKKKPDRPPLFQTMCIGKIVTHAELPDGRFNLLLCGARRARIIREIPVNVPYRMADVKLLDADSVSARSDSHSGRMREQTLKLFRELAAADPRLDQEALAGLASGDLPLGLLLDLMAFSSGANVLRLQTILETTDIGERCRRVNQLLRQRLAECQARTGLRYPPEFSYN